jgi:hypothetical protein
VNVRHGIERQIQKPKRFPAIVFTASIQTESQP